MTSAEEPLAVWVLRGGPDREREVSLLSGAQVAEALRQAGHQVTESDIGPDQLSVLDQVGQAVVFPVLHGPWGEGGPLQEALERRGLRFVGCGSVAARRCMDKAVTKRCVEAVGVPTAEDQVLRPGEKRTLAAPVVVKALAEGSSLGLRICHTDAEADQALIELGATFGPVLVERFVAGRELTVGLIDGRACSPIQIVPRVAFYDYEAKYNRNDTEYRFAIDLPAGDLQRLRTLAERAFAALGCRHLARADFLWGQDGPVLLEVNTLPGFTTHSLLPMAAAHDGWSMPQLVDRLVRLAEGTVADDPA